MNLSHSGISSRQDGEFYVVMLVVSASYSYYMWEFLGKTLAALSLLHNYKQTSWRMEEEWQGGRVGEQNKRWKVDYTRL